MNGLNSRSHGKKKKRAPPQVDAADAVCGSEDGQLPAAVTTAAAATAAPSPSPPSCPLRHPAAFWGAAATLRTEAKSNPSWRLIGGAAAPTLAAGGR